MEPSGGGRRLSLVEVIIALALLGIVLGGLVASVSIGLLGRWHVDEQSIALNLVRSQLESVKAQPYGDLAVYPTISAPAGYTVTVTGTTGISGLLQFITATVSTAEKTLLQAAAYKVKMATTAAPLSIPKTTPTAPPTLVVLAWDDFESGGWNDGAGWLHGWWHGGDASIQTDGSPHSGSYHLRLRRATAHVDRAVNPSGQKHVRLQFWAKVDSFAGDDFAEALVSSDGSTWRTMWRWTAVDSDGAYHFYDIDLSPYVISSELWIAFDAEMSGENDRLYIDDVAVIGY